MSTGTENTIGGKYDEIAGKVKQSVGEATHDNRIANEGAAQQVKGHAEQAWGSVQSATHDVAEKERARREDVDQQKAHSVRESITSTAQNVKNNIQNSADNYRAEHKR